MKVHIPTFEHGARVSYKHALCVPTADGGITMGNNINPAINWSDFPSNTKSFALVCVDPDVPSVGDDVNVEGKTVPADLPRVDFYHWVLADIPAIVTKIDSGADSTGVTERGKTPGKTHYGGITGINDYTNWFANDENMKGFYGGYDGPCPPWNDERIHHYHFKVFALDVETLGLSGNFTGRELISSIQGHVLAEAQWVGQYTLNKNLISLLG
ncbi:MAG: YbhB/YbcL family Raf kinase inhibitor-like protein [Candidatus Kapabacteria bacterium]|nr:YbhB/YbcL family Raf kinase inhibitor-like protein [Ignavibacteriota bacterium]MCW5883755.1 YbhB/YbcL family Raf kinase inhibitor-like protein [Candidatus Kapabacteria bacterium]